MAELVGFGWVGKCWHAMGGSLPGTPVRERSLPWGTCFPDCGFPGAPFDSAQGRLCGAGMVSKATQDLRPGLNYAAPLGLMWRATSKLQLGMKGSRHGRVACPGWTGEAPVPTWPACSAGDDKLAGKVDLLAPAY